MAKYVVNAGQKQSKINREIYGNFSEHLGRCIYEGLFVGEDSSIPNTKGMRNDVVAALKHINLPVLRWPGGCFADEYHWKDGIGHRENRKKMVNTHWGGTVEDNSFGTHEFFELCGQIGCEPYINGNVGSGTVQEMQEWVEYMTFDGISPMAELRKQNGQEKPWKVKYFGVGNENWGCGGHMRASFYADLYRQFQTYVRNFSDNKIYKIACGPGSSRENPNYEWLETVLQIAHDKMDGISMHYYTLPNDNWENKGSATDFTVEAYEKTMYKALFLDELLVNAKIIMDRYDKQKRIGIIFDEWGTWYDVEPGTVPGFLYQQNTMRDALVAGVSLNIFNKHSDRVHMANIAQTVNVLQAVILTEGEKMLLTPTYHVFDLYKHHQGNTLLESYITGDMTGAKEGERIPMLHESASIDEAGNVHMTICNLSHDQAAEIDAELCGITANALEGHILTGAVNACNTFEHPESVKLAALSGICKTESGFKLSIPPVSVVRITAKANGNL